MQAATFIFGFGKLIHQKMRLRKHTKRLAEQKAHLEQVRESRPIIQLNREEIPFGIRAIEAGIEVEGVVISRPGTPFSLPRRSQVGSTATLVGSDGSHKVVSASASRTSLPSPTIQPPRPVFQPSGPVQPAVLRKSPPRVYQPSPYINMPSQAYLESSSGRSSLSSLESQGSSSGHGSGEFTPTTPNSFQYSTDFHVEPLYARRFTPNDMGKHSVALTESDYASTAGESIARLEGSYDLQSKRSLSAPDLPSLTNGGGSSTSSSPSSSPPDILSPFLQPVFEGELNRARALEAPFDFEFPFRDRPKNARASTNPLDYQADSAHSSLSMLDLHRITHAAEVGQLQSRKRNVQPVPSPGMSSRDAGSVFSSYSELDQQLIRDGRLDLSRPLSASTDGAEDRSLTESQKWVLEALVGTGITQRGNLPHLTFEPEVPAYMTRDLEPGSLEERRFKRLSLTFTGNQDIDDAIFKRLSLTLADKELQTPSNESQQIKPERRRLQKRRSTGPNAASRVSANIAA